jgi:PAS domain S-box-containing protein
MRDSADSQRHNLPQVLRVSSDAQRLFGALLESAPDAMLIVDEHGPILLANSQTEKLFGYNYEELTGQAVEKLLPERFALP